MSNTGRGLWQAVVLFASLGLLTGCGDESASSAVQTDDGADPSKQGAQNGGGDELAGLLVKVGSGESMLTLSGVVNATAEDVRDIDTSEDVYRPALGGGAARRGSNAEGPYSLTFYTDVVHQDDSENVVQAWASMVLPASAEAGRTYTIASFNDADDDQVQAHLRGHGEVGTMGRQVHGTLYLAELGEQASAAWQFDAADGRGEGAGVVSVAGAVKGISFTPQQEARYEVTINGETESHLGRVTVRETPNNFAMSIGNRIVLDVPMGIEAGDYPLSHDSGNGAIRVSLLRHEVEKVEGSIRFNERDGVFDAELAFEAGGEDEVSLSGYLEGLDFES